MPEGGEEGRGPYCGARGAGIQFRRRLYICSTYAVQAICVPPNIAAPPAVHSTLPQQYALRTRARGRSEQSIFVGVVQSVERLSLDRVEVCEAAAVQLLVLLVPERRQRQGVQVQQLYVRGRVEG